MPYSVFVMRTVKLEVVCAESLLVLFALLGSGLAWTAKW